jgi:CCR4-NOT transcriptional regulation complex NOT5 subunit
MVAVLCACRIQNADIKDKTSLVDARKSIERDMERFKACEREMKAAGRGGNLKPADPREKAKEDAREWVNTAVDTLQNKVPVRRLSWRGKGQEDWSRTGEQDAARERQGYRM